LSVYFNTRCNRKRDFPTARSRLNLLSKCDDNRGIPPKKEVHRFQRLQERRLQTLSLVVQSCRVPRCTFLNDIITHHAHSYDPECYNTKRALRYIEYDSQTCILIFLTLRRFRIFLTLTASTARPIKTPQSSLRIQHTPTSHKAQ
jgi:hypothetical protein